MWWRSANHRARYVWAWMFILRHLFPRKQLFMFACWRNWTAPPEGGRNFNVVKTFDNKSSTFFFPFPFLFSAFPSNETARIDCFEFPVETVTCDFPRKTGRPTGSPMPVLGKKKKSYSCINMLSQKTGNPRSSAKTRCFSFLQYRKCCLHTQIIFETVKHSQSSAADHHLIDGMGIELYVSFTGKLIRLPLLR